MSAISQQYIELDIPNNNSSVVDIDIHNENDIKINNFEKKMLNCFCKYHQLEPIEEYQQKLKKAINKGLNITVLIAEKDTFGADKIKMLLEMY